MTVLGFFTGGASSILSSACSVDLGHEGMVSIIIIIIITSLGKSEVDTV